MCKRGLLCGGNWPATRMLCSSVVTLFYTILASRGSFQPESLFKSLATGRKLLDQLAKQSYSASRFKFILVMTSTLPESLQHVRDRLFNFDSEAPNVRSMETPEHNCGISNNSYTASLAGMVFSARPDSRLRRPNLLPLGAGLTQHSDGGILKSDLAREKHQYLQIGQALSSPMNEATEWATMQPKIQTTETNAPGNQRLQSPFQTPHLQIQAATEDTQFSPMPNATAPEPSDQHWQAQTFRSHQDGSAVAVCNAFDIDNAEHLEINEGSLTDIFNAGEFNLGDIDEFFDFGSWF
ncbi:hypothetical protein PENPOL_c007G03522 [Penicillium polonicum]|uniref:Uncharacterized protein n=1 Tax=Penicillium polonicum TaxID=60169 RepID=A0A1V6NIG7_PENPO|nr:hypothetical protein PENPOL_c007G03522 [Penicillium polonicum]